MSTDYNNIVIELNDYSPDDVDILKIKKTNDIINEDEFGVALGGKFSKLCQIAKMDAWHDHHTINELDPDTIDEFVVRHIPTGYNCYKKSGTSGSTSGSTPGSVGGTGRPTDEDIFIYRYLLSDAHKANPESQAKCKPNCETGFESNGYGDDFYDDKMVKERYIVGHVPFVSTGDDDKISCDTPSFTAETNEQTSQVQHFFVSNGIDENIFIIRDVAYGNWADDITKWGKGIYTDKTSQMITLQSAAGIFDPGPSTNPFTKGGVRQGFVDLKSNSRYAIFDSFSDDNTFNNEETVIRYQKTDVNIEEPIFRNQLLYTRYECLLYAKTAKLENKNIYYKQDAKTLIESANVNFIVSVPEGNKEHLYITTQKNSNKAKSILELPENDIPVKLSASKKGTLDTRIFTNYDYKDIIEHSGKLKIMTKKFGDHGQAVTCCRNKLSYQLIEPKDNIGEMFSITKGETNGLHAFLSYDRVAVASAIYYGCPIVIFTNHYGATIFLSKKISDTLNTPVNKHAMAIKNNESKKKTFEILSSDKLHIDIQTSSDSSIEKIKEYLSVIQQFIQDIYTYLMETSIDKENAGRLDIAYQALFLILINVSTFINIYSSHIILNKNAYENIEAITASFNLLNVTHATIEGKTEDEIIVIIDKIKVNNNEIHQLNNKLSTNISNISIVKDIEQNFKNIKEIIEVTGGVTGDSFKKLSLIRNKLKINKINKELIDKFNPYAGTQNERTWRSQLTGRVGEIYTQLGLVLLEDFYSDMQNYVFNDFLVKSENQLNVDIKDIFSMIMNRIARSSFLNKATQIYFLTSVGREIDDANDGKTKQLDSGLVGSAEITRQKNAIVEAIEALKTPMEAEKKKELADAKKIAKKKSTAKAASKKITIFTCKFSKKVQNLELQIETLYSQLADVVLEERINANVNLNYDRSVNYFVEDTFSRNEIYDKIQHNSTGRETELTSINQLEIPVEEIEDTEIITIDMEIDKPNSDDIGGDEIVIKTKDDVDIEDDTLTTKQYHTKFNKATKTDLIITTRSGKKAITKILRSGVIYGGGKKINRRKTYKRRKTKHKKVKQKKNTQKRRKTKRKKMKKGGEGPTQVLQQPQSHGLFGQEPTEADLERMYEQNDKEMRDQMEKQKQMEAKTTTAAEAEAKSQQRPTNHYELFLHSMNYAIDTNKNISETYKMILTYTKINKTKLVNKAQSSLMIKIVNLSETRFLLETVKTILDQTYGSSEGQSGGGRQSLKTMLKTAFSQSIYQGKAKKYVEAYLKQKKVEWITFARDILTFAQTSGEVDIATFVKKTETGYTILETYELDLTGFAYFLHILKNSTKKILPEDFKQLKIELLNNADYFTAMISHKKPEISEKELVTITTDGKRVRDITEITKFNDDLNELDRIDDLSQTDNNFPAFNTNVILQTMISNSSLLTIFMNFLIEEYNEQQKPSYSTEEHKSVITGKINDLIANIDGVRSKFAELQISRPDDDETLFIEIQRANTIEELQSIH